MFYLDAGTILSLFVFVLLFPFSFYSSLLVCRKATDFWSYPFRPVSLKCPDSFPWDLRLPFNTRPEHTSTRHAASCEAGCVASRCFPFSVTSLFFFFLNVADLQCSVHFCCTAKRPRHTSACILFLVLTSVVWCHRRLDRAAGAGQRHLVAYPFSRSQLHLPNPDSPPTHSVPLPLGDRGLLSCL